MFQAALSCKVCSPHYLSDFPDYDCRASINSCHEVIIIFLTIIAMMVNLLIIAHQQGYSRMSENYIVGENRYKQKIMLNPQDLVGSGILNDGLYDRTGLHFIEKILSRLNNPVALDIGANIGNHALRMSEYCKMVYLFEPQLSLSRHLHTTMALNNISNWNIFNVGLSDEEKTLPLFKNLDGNNGETSFVAELKGKNFLIEEAAICIGDNVLHKHNITHIDFIKIDVEGFEAKVIAGLKKSIQQYRPIIFMEWDKEITKQQFQEYNLFDTVFGDYSIKAISRNPSESSLYKKIQHKIHHLFNKNISKKRKIIGEFNQQSDYRHVVFVPNEKIHVLNDL